MYASEMCFYSSDEWREAVWKGNAALIVPNDDENGGGTVATRVMGGQGKSQGSSSPGSPDPPGEGSARVLAP